MAAVKQIQKEIRKDDLRCPGCKGPIAISSTGIICLDGNCGIFGEIKGIAADGLAAAFPDLKSVCPADSFSRTAKPWRRPRESE